MGKRTLAILLVLVTTQWLFFSNSTNHLARLTIPWMGSVGFSILILLAHTFLYFISRYDALRNAKNYAFSSSIISIATAVLTTFRASPVDQFLLAIVSLVFLFITAYLLAINHDRFGAISEVVLVPIMLALNWFLAAVKTINDIIKTCTNAFSGQIHTKPKNVSNILLGIAITIPVIFVLIALLSFADPVFSKTIGKLIAFDWVRLDSWILARSIFAVAIAFLSLPFFNLIIPQSYKSIFANKKQWMGMITPAYILVISVLVVMTSFLLIQFPYIFAQVPETQLHQFGVQTYSEYVRRGFVELTLVSILIYSVSFVCLVIYRAKNQSLLRFLNFLLIGEGLIFIFSIFRRVYLYQALHGLTRIRVYGTAFLILMILLSIVLALRHLLPKINWYIWEVLITAFVVVTVSLIGVDKFIAEYHPPTVNEQVDYVYISKLSTEATSGLILSYKHSVLELNSFAKKSIFTEDDRRQLIYLNQTLHNLRQKYAQLALVYGTQTDYEKLQIFTYFKYIPSEIKYYNFADLAAYAQLVSQIPADEIIAANNLSQQLLNQIPPSQMPALDRSLSSPLDF